jgi:hypothetical protein
MVLDMISESWWLSGLEFDSHYPYLFDKNQAQGNISLRKFQAQRIFTWGDVLENNINYILRSHLRT